MKLARNLDSLEEELKTIFMGKFKQNYYSLWAKQQSFTYK